MTDRCAACFRVLLPAPLDGRYECDNPAHRGARIAYWSEAIPEGTGENDEARLESKHGRPTLYYYGGMRR